MSYITPPSSLNYILIISILYLSWRSLSSKKVIIIIHLISTYMIQFNWSGCTWNPYSLKLPSVIETDSPDWDPLTLTWDRNCSPRKLFVQSTRMNEWVNEWLPYGFEYVNIDKCIHLRVKTSNILKYLKLFGEEMFSVVPDVHRSYGWSSIWFFFKRKPFFLPYFSLYR